MEMKCNLTSNINYSSTIKCVYLKNKVSLHHLSWCIVIWTSFWGHFSFILAACTFIRHYLYLRRIWFSIREQLLPVNQTPCPSVRSDLIFCPIQFNPFFESAGSDMRIHLNQSYWWYTALIDKYQLRQRSYLSIASFSKDAPTYLPHTHNGDYTVHKSIHTRKLGVDLCQCQASGIKQPVCCRWRMSSTGRLIEMYRPQGLGVQYVATAAIVCLNPPSVNFNHPRTGVINKPFHGIHTNM